MRPELRICQTTTSAVNSTRATTFKSFMRLAIFRRSSTRFFASHACHTVSSRGFDGVADSNRRPWLEINEVDIFEPLTLHVTRLSAAGENRRPHSSEPDPNGYLAAIGVPISVPITSPEITNSTRRFC